MIGWRARVHQQGDSVLLVTYHTKRGNSGTRRSPAPPHPVYVWLNTVSLAPLIIEAQESREKKDKPT